MSLFGRRNKNIGGQLKTQAAKVAGKDPAQWTAEDVCNYFLKVGLDHKGDLQSYLYNKGSSKSVELKVDLIALAAACAGVPLPETPVFAEVGIKVTLDSFKSNLIIAYVGPRELHVDGSDLKAPEPVVFLAMSGYKWERGVSVSAEVGVKTPSITPSPTGGSWSSDAAEVKGGTYAELAAFDLSAKASIAGEAGLSGERLYVSDPVPTFLARSSGSITSELRQPLMSVLQHGDKKALLKAEVKGFLEAHNAGQKRSMFKRFISGGDVQTSTLVSALQSLSSSDDANVVGQAAHHIRALQDFKAADVLASYWFVSLWGMKPHASAGVSAKASASVKASVGVASAGVGGEVKVQGPSIATTLKFTRYRLQIATLAVHKRPPLRRTKARRNLFGSHRGGGESSAPTSSTPNYMVMTQDTKISYGQMDLTAIGVEASFEAKAQQGLVKVPEGRLQKKIYETPEDKGQVKGKLGEARGSLMMQRGLQETGVTAKASARLGTALNFMYYESAVALWIPPAEQGAERGEKRELRLGPGSGFAFGQSVDVKTLQHNLELLEAGGKPQYLAELGGCIGVTPHELRQFFDGCDGLIADLAGGDNEIKPSAFLIEATFAPRSLPQVEAKWEKGRWVLGPFGLGKTLRGLLIPDRVSSGTLQAIRLRYRLADEATSSITRFSLGVKYIASLGLEYKSVEQAGSEGIINLATTWFNEFRRYNSGAQTEAYEQAVPQVALLHQ